MTTNNNDWKGHQIEINNKICPCKAAGIMPYTIINNNIYFLFQKPNNKKSFYTDFGGKREEYDHSIIRTAAREFSEETNGCFFLFNYINEINNCTSNNINKSTIITESILLNENLIFLYNYTGKYILYFLYIYPININLLGNYELSSKHQIKRNCEWIHGSKLIQESFINNNLQHRLRKGFKKTIYKLYKSLNIII